MERFIVYESLNIVLDKIKYLEYITIVMIGMSGLIVYSELKRCFK